jgi:NAD(P)-dependent dehydrogenase (short-subunit alcohol dehydrogenase family)
MFEHRQKTFIVTGANTGVGLATAKALAKSGARIVMAVRDRDKGEAAMAELREETGHDDVTLQMLDLADLSSVREAAESLSKNEERIDVLINNAGLGHAKGGQTKDGFDLVMGVNHLGTFAFTEALMDKIISTAAAHGEARVVNLSSMAHQFARKFDPCDLMPEKRSFGRDAYSESKLCNLLHAREMARRYGMAGVRAHAVHPGFVNSNFSRPDHFPGIWQLIFMLTKPMQISPKKAAKTVLAAALDDDGAWNNGAYWDKEKVVQPTLPHRPEKVAQALWEESERLLAEKGFVIEHETEIGGPVMGASFGPSS